MIADTSAIVAIVFREKGYRTLIEKIAAAPSVGMSAASAVEAGIVLTARLGRDARPALARLFAALEIEIIPLVEAHWAEAAGAYVRFGKGRHKARLNFGDCLTYVIAALANQPLLFTGNDFARTDLIAA